MITSIKGKHAQPQHPQMVFNCNSGLSYIFYIQLCIVLFVILHLLYYKQERKHNVNYNLKIKLYLTTFQFFFFFGLVMVPYLTSNILCISTNFKTTI